MVMMLKKPSQYDRVPLGLLGGVFCLLAVIPSGSVLGEQGVSQVQESKVEEGKNLKVGGESKTQRWTVPCEREDGSRGIFLVSSKVPRESSSLALDEDETVEVNAIEKPPTPNLTDPSPAPAESEEDPFGNPTLKCGRLLTLLAIFASGEFHSP